MTRTPAWKAARAEIDDAHPERWCQRCERRNIPWSADNDLWNEVVGSPNGILCPLCFADAARAKGIEFGFVRITK